MDAVGLTWLLRGKALIRVTAGLGVVGAGAGGGVELRKLNCGKTMEQTSLEEEEK